MISRSQQLVHPMSIVSIVLAALSLLAVSSKAQATPFDDPAPFIVSTNHVPTWDCQKLDPKYVAWRTQTGSINGSLSVAKDHILLGTNNEHPRDAKSQGERGVVMCFQRDTGRYLWQNAHPRMKPWNQDLPGMAITSKPSIEDGKAYYVSNRGELTCLDLLSGRLIWQLDMIIKLGVEQRQATDAGNPVSSPLIVGELLYCLTGNSADFDGVHAPNAPSFLAVDKKTGKVAWSSNLPGKNLIWGQWSSPVYVKVDGEGQIVFPGGDGVLYGLTPLTGQLLWKIDCGEPSPLAEGPLGGGKRNFFMSTPVVKGNIIFVAPNQTWEFGGSTHPPLYAIELTKQGKAATARIKWTFNPKEFKGTFGSVAVGNGVVFVVNQAGILFALDETTGKEHWRSDLVIGMAQFSSPVLHKDRLYIASEDGDLFVFSVGGQPRCLGKYYCGESIHYCSPVIQDELLYVATNKYLWALKIPDFK